MNKKEQKNSHSWENANKFQQYLEEKKKMAVFRLIGQAKIEMLKCIGVLFRESHLCILKSISY